MSEWVCVCVCHSRSQRHRRGRAAQRCAGHGRSGTARQGGVLRHRLLDRDLAAIDSEDSDGGGGGA